LAFQASRYVTSTIQSSWSPKATGDEYGRNNIRVVNSVAPGLLIMKPMIGGRRRQEKGGA